MAKDKQVRAVIRRIDKPRLTTSWVSSESPEMQRLLIEVLPPAGETFLVVWEERKDSARAASAPDGHAKMGSHQERATGSG